MKLFKLGRKAEGQLGCKADRLADKLTDYPTSRLRRPADLEDNF